MLFSALFIGYGIDFLEHRMTGPQFEPIFWPGSGSSPVGLTPQGIFDDDDEFVEVAPKFADWAARRLGYPVMAVEMTDAMFYACFEEAIIDYSAQINEFNMRENMLYLQGLPTGTSLSQTLVTTSPVSLIVEMSQAYGTEAGVGGTVDVKRIAVPLTASISQYDLQQIIGATSESGRRIEIRRVFHGPPPAISRIFDPFAASGMGVSNLMGAFGWGGYSVETTYLLTPVYETLLRVQAIEFNDQIRRSQYTFELTNNKIRLYPTPDGSTPNLWVDYIVRDSRFSGSGSIRRSVVSDYSNAPYSTIPYSRINDVGKRWIWRYALACCKETLGAVRVKYTTIPIPNSEIQMDGATLKLEAAQEKELLWTQLRETLEKAGRRNQLEAVKENEMNAMEVLKLVPLRFYIG